MRTCFDQVIAVGGTLLLTSNMVMVRDGMLQEWFERHHNEWPGVQARQLVQRVDELFCRWWQHRRGPRAFRFYESDQDFPKKVWYEADGQTWIGYCVNRTTGDYKGWPIDDGERRAVFG